jgi:subtilisin family serine protease
MKKSALFICLIIISSLLTIGFNASGVNPEIIETNGVQYLANTVIVKFKSPPGNGLQKTISLSKQMNTALASFGVQSAELLFPVKNGQPLKEINKIAEIKYNSKSDPLYVASKLNLLEEIEWAEPRYVYQVSYIPNDPSYSLQYYLPQIKAQEAWDIVRGDTSIVIGIIDTGIDWDHPDLAANIWINYGEIPDNGIDDDGNGFIDDYRGWDFAGTTGSNPDNDPMEDGNVHGTYVAGAASAVSDNGIGIASIGFECKLMAVKTSPGASTLIYYGYEGIKYAADNGAKIINCSFGGSGFSRFGQETINHAISKGALVVAAAGNTENDTPQYPASYDGVLSVAGVDSGDKKAWFTSFNYAVDVSAPGVGIYTTRFNDEYGVGQGTSLSSPIVSGIAALVASRFPSYTPHQIAEQIRVNSDDIYLKNPDYLYKLGKGRVNAFNALSNTNSISVRAVNIEFTDEAPGGNGDGIFLGGETITIAAQFTNYLIPTSNLQITLESRNNFGTVLNGTLNVGAKGTLESFDNYTAKFTFKLNDVIPQNTELDFNLIFSDGSYSDFQAISTLANPSYGTQAGNDVALTITSKGTLGFNDYPNNSQGRGFVFRDGDNLLFEGALMIGVSSTKVSDGARAADQAVQSDNFQTIVPFQLHTPGEYADQEGLTVFDDEPAGDNKLGVTVTLKSFSFADLPHDNYIILRYNIKNNSASILNNLFVGLFLDWDFEDAINDFTSYDVAGNLGYVYRIGGNPDTHVGTALISSDNYNFYAINNAGGDGGFSIYDGFSKAEKWLAMSGGIGKSQAGGGDVSHVVSGGPLTIQSGDSINVAFALLAADNLEGLRTAVSNARERYKDIPTNINEITHSEILTFELFNNYPNPFNPITTIEYQIPQSEFVTLKVFDALGREVTTLVNDEKPAGNYTVTFNAANLTSGIYYYRISTGRLIKTMKAVLVK